MAWAEKLADMLRLNDGNQPYVGFPQMQVGLNKPRQAGYATGFLEGATGMDSMQPKNPITDPNYDRYAQGKNTGEAAGIAAMALPAYAGALRAGAPKAYDALENYMTKTGGMQWAYQPNTPLKPNPMVGKTFETEYLGGLAEKTPRKIEDFMGSSALIMPWDSTSRNYAIKSISGEALPRQVVTHGGQDYARDLSHIEQGIGGASNLDIAKRIKDRDTQARIENLKAGGTGNVLHFPTTMGEGAENFSVMPTEAVLGIIDARDPSKKFLKELDESIRNFPVAKNTSKGRIVTQPFKDFAGIGTEEGRMQLYSGEGIGSTAGELRKAFTNRATLKGNQEYLGFNAEDLAAALRDPALTGVPKGWVGNTILQTGEGGMHLRPSKNPTYSTDFTADYQGTLGQSVPVEVLFPKVFEDISTHHAHKSADLRNMVLGAMEKKKGGVSELIDQQVVDNYYKYLEDLKKNQ
jgi:hypothetical protein